MEHYQVSGLLSSFLVKTSSQRCPFYAGVPQVYFLRSILFLLYVNDLSDMFPVILLPILKTMLSILYVTRPATCDNCLSWLLKSKPIFHTMWIGVGSGLLLSMLGEFKFASFDWSGWDCPGRKIVFIVAGIFFLFWVKFTVFLLLKLPLENGRLLSCLDWCSLLLLEYVGKTAKNGV